MEFRILNNQIEHETNKAFLFKMPSKSPYKNKKFWLPKSFVKKNRDSFTVWLPKDFEVTVFKDNKKDGEVIDAEELSSHFPIVSDNISYLKIEEPKKVSFEKVEVHETLKR